MIFQASDYIIGFGVTILVYVYLHLTRNFQYWKYQNVPHAKPILIFGNAFKICTFQVSIGEFIYNLYKATTSKVYGFYVFDQPFLLVRDPEVIKHVLVKDFEYFSDRSIISNGDDDKFGSSMLFTLKNPSWRNVRRKVTPAFTSGKIKNMVPLIVETCQDLNEHINNSSSNEFYARNLAMKFTTDLITTCAFGITANSFKSENSEFFIASERVLEKTLPRGIQAVSAFLAPLLFKLFKMRFIEPSSVEFMEKAFLETLREREKSQVYRGDLIDILLKVKNDEKIDSQKFDDELLVSQAIQFFVAGYETTGTTIFSSLHELSLNPTIQEKLRQEIKTVLTKYGKITYEAVQEMVYLDMVLYETLRKYPVLPYLDRRCTKTYKFPETDIVIKKGMPVYVSLIGLHYDPDYFPDPDKYDPERFSPENKNKIPNYVYMPFGKGLHNCIGGRFALIASKIGLISILSNYEIKSCQNSVKSVIFNPYGFSIAPTSDIKMKFILNIISYKNN